MTELKGILLEKEIETLLRPNLKVCKVSKIKHNQKEQP